MNDIVKKRISISVIVIMAVILVIAALFALWWFGAFLSRDITWDNYETIYENGYVKVENRHLYVYSVEDEEKLLVDGVADVEAMTKVYRSPADWFVQKLLAEDIDRDGKEELVALVWKHGSYGEHRPLWEKRNDIRLEQHIFVFRWEEQRDNRLRSVWMSSALGFEVNDICMYGADKILVNDNSGNSMVWYWQDFGLKLAGEAKERHVNLLCAGDNLIHQNLYNYDIDGLYSDIKPYIENADIAAVCQETVIAANDMELTDFPRFAVKNDVAEALKNAGFDVFAVSNNHILDKGMEGIDSTYNALADDEHIVCGINPSEKYSDDLRKSVRFKTIDHVRIAFLSYTYGTNGMPMPEGYKYAAEKLENEARIIQQIRYAKARADAVIVFAHWGTEYDSQLDELQQKMGDLFVEEKVDVVIGSHPHVLQKFDSFKDKSGHETVIFYSLGNFVSGQDGEARQTGGIADVDIAVDKAGKLSVDGYKLIKTKMVRNEQDAGVHLYTEENN